MVARSLSVRRSDLGRYKATAVRGAPELGRLEAVRPEVGRLDVGRPEEGRVEEVDGAPSASRRERRGVVAVLLVAPATIFRARSISRYGLEKESETRWATSSEAQETGERRKAVLVFTAHRILHCTHLLAHVLLALL